MPRLALPRRLSSQLRVCSRMDAEGELQKQHQSQQCQTKPASCKTSIASRAQPFASSHLFFFSLFLFFSQLPYISYCGRHSRVSGADVMSLPQFANATFSSFTLPEDDEVDAQRNNNTKSASARDKKKDAKRRRSGGAANEADGYSSDSAFELDDDEVVDVTDARRRMQRAPASSSASSRRASSAAAAAAQPAPGRRLIRIVFKNNEIPFHVHLQYADGSQADNVVFINSAQSTKRKLKRKIKQASAADQLIKLDPEEGGEEQTQEAMPAAASAAASSSTEESPSKRARLDDNAIANGIDASGASSALSSAAIVGNRRLTSSSPDASASQDQSTCASSVATASSFSLPSATPASSSGSTPMAMDEDEDDEDEVLLVDENERLYCVCQQPWRDTMATMIGCHSAEACAGQEWYHLVCLGLTGEEATAALEAEVWYCPSCVNTGRASKTTAKQQTRAAATTRKSSTRSRR